MLFFKVIAIFLVMPVLASATTLSFAGNLDPANANDVFLASFTLSGTSNLQVQSWGYGGTLAAPGGTNAAGIVIPAGGFDTYVSLFQGTGSSATFLASNDDGDVQRLRPTRAAKTPGWMWPRLPQAHIPLRLHFPTTFPSLRITVSERSVMTSSVCRATTTTSPATRCVRRRMRSM